MRDLKKQERTAIEAVARRFSGTWEKGSDPPDAYIMVAGKRVAVDIQKRQAQRAVAQVQLRFDRSDPRDPCGHDQPVHQKGEHHSPKCAPPLRLPNDWPHPSKRRRMLQNGHWTASLSGPA